MIWVGPCEFLRRRTNLFARPLALPSSPLTSPRPPPSPLASPPRPLPPLPPPPSRLRDVHLSGGSTPKRYFHTSPRTSSGTPCRAMSRSLSSSTKSSAVMSSENSCSVDAISLWVVPGRKQAAILRSSVSIHPWRFAASLSSTARQRTRQSSPLSRATSL